VTLQQLQNQNIPTIAEKPKAIGQQLQRQFHDKYCQTNAIQNSNKRTDARHDHRGRL